MVNTVTIDLIAHRCSPWCNHMDYFFVSDYFIYLIAQLVPRRWGMFFTQQTSCLPHVLLITTSWYIGIYTVDTLLYSLCFTNCIILFLPQLSYHSQVFTWVLQPELLCHKLHSAISPPILRRFPRSQCQLKALKKTFWSIPVTSQSDQ